MRAPVAAFMVCGLVAPQAFAQHMNAQDAPCRDKAGTVEAANCFNNAHRAADKTLNQIYGKVRKGLEPREQQALLNAERLWARYRDADCAAERDLYEGGSASGPAYQACLEAQTRHRIAELHAAYDWRIEK